MKEERLSEREKKVRERKSTTPEPLQCPCYTIRFMFFSEEELKELFPEKGGVKNQSDNVEKNDNKKGKIGFKSALSAQIEKFPAIPNNPFNEFSRFDGRISDGVSMKRIAIFLTMLPSPTIDYPMEVVVVSQAQVKDLIGLICWQYTNEGREPKLKPGVNRYCLRIAEENGDVDPDFPSLNPKEPVSKFGFPVLALVEKEEDELNASLVVTVYVLLTTLCSDRCHFK